MCAFFILFGRGGGGGRDLSPGGAFWPDMLRRRADEVHVRYWELHPHEHGGEGKTTRILLRLDFEWDCTADIPRGECRKVCSASYQGEAEEETESISYSTSMRENEGRTCLSYSIFQLYSSSRSNTGASFLRSAASWGQLRGRGACNLLIIQHGQCAPVYEIRPRKVVRHGAKVSKALSPVPS